MDSCCRLELKQEMSEIPMLLPLFMTTQLLDMCLAKGATYTPQKSAHSEHKSHLPILVRRNGATTATYTPANTVADLVTMAQNVTT